MSNFVLVHGAWHGGWCWHKIAARLEALGHTVAAPDFPGHGADTAPIADVTFDDIVARICDAVDAQTGPVTLVGHSYGGAVITQVGELRAGKVRKLVYLTAFLLGDGQSVMDAASGDTDNSLAGAIEFSPDGRTATVKDEVVKEAFYAQCGNEDIALARQKLRPEAVAGFQTPVRTSAAQWGRIPRAYIECTEDRAISIGQQRRMHGAHPCERIVTLESDHSPFFSMPDELTAVLSEL